jgi:hypothetical protein
LLRFAVTPTLDLGMSYAWQQNEQKKNRSKQEFPDVFERAFGYYVGSRARDLCESRSDDPTILGWFIDNELRWGSDWRGADELLTLFLSLDQRSAGRGTAFALLRKRYPDFTEFNSVWRTLRNHGMQLSASAGLMRLIGASRFMNNLWPIIHAIRDSRHSLPIVMPSRLWSRSAISS